MKKEQFLAMSLPSGLFLYHSGGVAVPMSYTENKNCKVDGFSIGQANSYHYLTPICHPLYDLTKPITHNGETFVPTEKLKELFGKRIEFDGYTFYNHINPSMVREKVDYPVYFKCINAWLKLAEWHFNLMDEGEPFIDVNTLEINPYA